MRRGDTRSDSRENLGLSASAIGLVGTLRETIHEHARCHREEQESDNGDDVIGAGDL